MTDDQSHDSEGDRSDDSSQNGYRNDPSRRRVRFAERAVDFDSWSDPERGLSREVLDVKALGSETAVFKARVQRGGRISIPDAERESLGIRHGQIVQALVFPLAVGEADDETDTDTDDADESEEAEGADESEE